MSDGYRTKASELGIGGIPILRVAEVLEGVVRPVFKDHVRSEFRPKMRGKTSLPNDVLITTKGTVGRAAMISSTSPEFVYSPQLCVLRALDTQVIDPHWLYCWVRSPQFQAQAHVVAGQTDMAPYINLVDLRSMTIDLPPIETQRAIAEILGVLDEKIALNGRIRGLVLRTATAMYEKSVAGSSSSTTLKAAGKWLSGGTPNTSNPEYWGGSIPWISAASLKSFFVSCSDRTLTDVGARSGTRLAPAGAVLFVVRGMSLKSEFRVGVAQREVAFGQDCKAVVLHDDLPTATVAVGLLAVRDTILALVDEAGHGTGRLPTDRLEQVRIRLPESEHVRHMEDALSSLVRRGAEAEEENRRLVVLRDALLPPLMSGELQVRDVETLAGVRP
ncbi:restriction endonuclease subunit S [Blastococcus sp. SYSU D00820]